MRFENGNTIDMELTINRELEPDSHVWVILKEDLALMEADQNANNHLDWEIGDLHKLLLIRKQLRSIYRNLR